MSASDKARMVAYVYAPHGVGHQGPRQVLALRRLKAGRPRRGRPEAQTPLFVAPPLDVACPSCEAARGAPCTLGGKAKATPHRRRSEASDVTFGRGGGS